MISHDQFNKARYFIYRQGRLLDQLRFAFHFENGSAEAVVNALGGYQNEDGGFGHGLELDITCPDSSPICMEVALATLVELGVKDNDVLDKTENWILTNQNPDTGLLPHPSDDVIEQYPHGPWWKGGDDDRVVAIAGLLSKLGRGDDTFYERTAKYFDNKFGQGLGELAVYSYPVSLYLNFAMGAASFDPQREELKNGIPGILEKEAWHVPLYYCHDRWHSGMITQAMWEAEAEKAIALLADDGGAYIEQYKDLPWWRPVWTMDLLVTLKARDLLT